MAADFPTSLHNFSATYADDTAQATTHPGIHNDLNEEVGALQTKVGIDGSADTDSLDYKVNSLLPVATVTMYGGSTAPDNWLLCDGSAISRSSYVNLFSVIGTTYGVGDGSNTFNLPDMRNKFPIGAGDTYSEGDTGGASSADVSHTHTTSGHAITAAEMPTHTHTQNAHTHTQNSHTHAVDPPNTNTGNQSASHTHAPSNGGTFAVSGAGTSANLTTGGGSYALVAGTGAQSASHTHAVNIASFTSGDKTATNQNTTATNQNAGSGESHAHGDTGTGGSTTQSILNPYVGINFIIKYA